MSLDIAILAYVILPTSSAHVICASCSLHGIYVARFLPLIWMCWVICCGFLVSISFSKLRRLHLCKLVSVVQLMFLLLKDVVWSALAYVWRAVGCICRVPVLRKGGFSGCTIHVWLNTSKYNGTFDSWALVLTNRYIWESTFTYIPYILEFSSLCIKFSIENKSEWYNTFHVFIICSKTYTPLSTLLRDSRTNLNDIICSCLIIHALMNVGPWWCKANPILIYQGVHCCTNVCHLHVDISPWKSVTIEYLLHWALYYVIREQIIHFMCLSYAAKRTLHWALYYVIPEQI